MLVYQRVWSWKSRKHFWFVAAHHCHLRKKQLKSVKASRRNGLHGHHLFNQWPWLRNLNWRYLPYIYIYMAYIRPNFQGISPQFIWPNIWYVYVPPSVGFCFIPIDLINWHPLGSTSHYDKTAGMASGWFWTRANVGIHIPAPFCLHMGYRADLSFFFVPFMQQIYIYI